MARSVTCQKGDAGQIEDGEDVGVAELVGQGDAEQIEIGKGAGRFQGGQRQFARAEELFAVEIGTVAAFRQEIFLTIEDMVENLQTLVRHADLVEIGKNQSAAQLHRFPGLDYGVVFMAEIATGLVDERQKGGVGHGFSPVVFTVAAGRGLPGMLDSLLLPCCRAGFLKSD